MSSSHAHIEVKCKLSRTIILVNARLNIKALQNFLKIQECDWNIAVQIISERFRGLSDLLRIDIKSGSIEVSSIKRNK